MLLSGCAPRAQSPAPNNNDIKMDLVFPLHLHCSHLPNGSNSQPVPDPSHPPGCPPPHTSLFPGVLAVPSLTCVTSPYVCIHWNPFFLWSSTSCSLLYGLGTGKKNVFSLCSTASLWWPSTQHPLLSPTAMILPVFSREQGSACLPHHPHPMLNSIFYNLRNMEETSRPWADGPRGLFCVI